MGAVEYAIQKISENEHYILKYLFNCVEQKRDHWTGQLLSQVNCLIFNGFFGLVPCLENSYMGQYDLVAELLFRIGKFFFNPANICDTNAILCSPWLIWFWSRTSVYNWFVS